MRRQRNTTGTRQLFKFIEKKVSCRGRELNDDVNLTSQKNSVFILLQISQEDK